MRLEVPLIVLNQHGLFQCEQCVIAHYAFKRGSKNMPLVLIKYRRSASIGISQKIITSHYLYIKSKCGNVFPGQSKHGVRIN